MRVEIGELRVEMLCRLTPTDWKTPTGLAWLGHLPQKGEASAPVHPLGAPPLGELSAKRTEGAILSREALLQLHSPLSKLHSLKEDLCAF